MTQPARSTLRAMYSQLSAQNLGSCRCPLTLHPEHCCSRFSPLKHCQDATMSSGTKVVPGVPEGRGRTTATSYTWRQAEFVIYLGQIITSHYFTRGEGHEKAQTSSECLAKHDQDTTNSKCKHHY